MGLRVQKRFGGSRGPRLTLGKRSASLSVGVPGFRVSHGKRGNRVTVGIPGSGISYTAKLGGKKQRRSQGRQHVQSRGYAETGPKHPNLTAVLLLLFFFPAGLWYMWARTTWRDDTKWAISGLFLWPLWARFVLRTAWRKEVQYGAIALLTVAYLATASPAAIVTVWIGLAAFVWVLTQRAIEDPVRLARDEERREEQWARAHLEGMLAECDALVVDIEATKILEGPQLDLYRDALDRRVQGREELERAKTLQDLQRSDTYLTSAVVTLRSLART